MEINLSPDDIHQLADAAAVKLIGIEEFIVKHAVTAARGINRSHFQQMQALKAQEKKNGVKLTECCSNCCRVPVKKKRHCDICTECWSEYTFSGKRKYYKQSVTIGSNKEYGATKHINQASSRRHHD